VISFCDGQGTYLRYSPIDMRCACIGPGRQARYQYITLFCSMSTPPSQQGIFSNSQHCCNLRRTLVAHRDVVPLQHAPACGEYRSRFTSPVSILNPPDTHTPLSCIRHRRTHASPSCGGGTRMRAGRVRRGD